MIDLTPKNERPRERCLKMGARCLSLRECVAILLNSGPQGQGCLGLASQILNRSGGGLNSEDEERAFFTAMESAGSAHLNEINGLGPAGKARILAAFELGRRYFIFISKNQAESNQKPSLTSLNAQALKKISSSYRNEPQEWLGFVPIHRSGKIGNLCIVERGARTHVNIDPAELFARILALRPKGFFLFHNHPSGSLAPSAPDFHLTEQVAKVAQHLGVILFDHGIVSSSGEQWILS